MILGAPAPRRAWTGRHDAWLRGQRFANAATRRVRWLHDRVAEILGLHYEIPWPNRER